MTDTMTTIFELRRSSAAGIYAVPYRGRSGSQPVRLMDGVIVERPTPDDRREAPDAPDACLSMATGGGPASLHHYQLGLVSAFLTLGGVFLLPNGEVAAVYGAEAVPLG
jgi:hypothetical protein